MHRAAQARQNGEHHMKAQLCILAGIGAIVGLAGCGKSQPPEPAKVENLTTLSATVEAIDVNNRLVALRGPEGNVATIEVSPEVRNLEQVKVGDKLNVKYRESLAAAIMPKGTSPTLNDVDQSATAARAAPGAMPGAAVGREVTTTVVIQSVDAKNHRVTFSGPDGLVRSVQAQKPEMQTFVQSLKQGDEVELKYNEALAVSVEPAQ
jgi:hypothetical protein